MVLAGALPTASSLVLPIGCGSRTALLLGDLTEPCVDDVDCDDGIACSREVCTLDGYCAREFEHALCSDAQYCNGDERCAPLRGCEPGLAPCDDSVACCGRHLLLIDTDTGASERLGTGSVACYGAAAR